MKSNTHIPVLLKEAISFLNIQPNHWYVDGTFGRGGHTSEILKKGGKVVAFDFDAEAVSYGREEFSSEINSGNLLILRENFSQLADVLSQLQVKKTISEISGMLFDFGTSTQQLTSQSRGFSFEGDGTLDMRMDQRLGVQAKDLLAVIPEKQLAELFFQMGGEQDAKKIAKEIKNSETPITTNKQLASLVSAIKKHSNSKLHPATKVFQALRIAVNTELDNISEMLPQALTMLKNNGHIVTIAFHDGEDRIVKHTFKKWETRNLGSILTKKPVSATENELKNNIRARSAKLRVFRKEGK